jgi:hypothetical protein
MFRAFYWSLSVGHIVEFSMKNDNKVEIRHKIVKLFFLPEGIENYVGYR